MQITLDINADTQQISVTQDGGEPYVVDTLAEAIEFIERTVSESMPELASAGEEVDEQQMWDEEAAKRAQSM